jgi:hypothetical protein
MTIRTMTSHAWLPVCLALLLPLAASASPPKAAHLPEDAKWVVHLDLEALSQANVVQEARDERPQMAQLIRRWFLGRYGVDPREDLDSLTMFSDTYEEHTGTMVLKAKYDQERVRTTLEQRPDVRRESWENHTIYTLAGGQPGFLRLQGAGQLQPGAGQRQGQAPGQQQAPGQAGQRPGQQQPGQVQQQPGQVQQQPGQVQQQPGQVQQQPGQVQQQPGQAGRAVGQAGQAQAQQQRGQARQQRQGADQGQQTEGMSVLLLDGETVIFASSADRVKSAAKLLKGDSPSLEGKDSALLAQLKDGAMVYGAAVNLQEIEQREGFFPVLAQHERIYWTIAEDNGQVRGNLTLHAQSDEVAEQMETALEGSVAFGRVWAADSENLKKVMENREVSRDGKTVQLSGGADSQTVRDALAEVAERFQQRFQLTGN